MKKLMIVAAVALAAVSVNAASVTWQTGTVYKPGTSDKITNSGKGYMFDVSDTYISQINAIVASDGVEAAMAQIYADYKDQTASGKAMANSATQTSFKGNKFYQGAGKFSTTEADAANQTVNKLVLFTWSNTSADPAKDYFIANLVTATSDSDGNWSAPLYVATNWGGAPTGDAIGWQLVGGPGPGPVPEPTSGLLLLLGVAGLALRRKQK